MNKDQLIAKLQSGQAHVAVVGMGYVGLPLALTFARAGYKVTGIDVSTQRVDSINRGVSYIEDISDAELAPFVALSQPIVAHPMTTEGVLVQPAISRNIHAHSANSGSLAATVDYSILAECDAVSICVPTPLNKTGDPDMSFIRHVGEQIAHYLHHGMVVVLESTTYPGTTREVLLTMFEQASAAQGHRLQVGEDFFLAFSPERVDPGRTDWMLCSDYNQPHCL